MEFFFLVFGNGEIGSWTIEDFERYCRDAWMMKDNNNNNEKYEFKF